MVNRSKVDAHGLSRFDRGDTRDQRRRQVRRQQA
jgi:hypothetical protein